MLPEVSSGVDSNASDQSAPQIIYDFIQDIKRNLSADFTTQNNTIEEFFKSDKSSNITSRDVIDIIKEDGIQDSPMKFVIIQEFLKSDKSIAITCDNFIEMINQAGIKDDFYKNIIIQEFLKSNKSSNITSRDVIDIIKEAKFQGFWEKVGIIKEFLKSDKSSSVSSDDVIAMINQAEINSDFAKGSIIQVLIESDKLTAITCDNVIAMITQAKITDDYVKGLIINTFIKSDKSTAITCVNVIAMINQAGIKDDREKRLIIDTFVKSDKSTAITSDDFIAMINQARFENIQEKISTIQGFLTSDKSPAITGNDAIKIINETSIEDRDKKASVMLIFFQSQHWKLDKAGKNDSESIDNFVNIIEGTGIKDEDLIFQIYASAFPKNEYNPENHVKNFIGIIKKLYPSEAVQCDSVRRAVQELMINGQNVQHLKPFIGELQDNDLALGLLEFLSERKIITNSKDELGLVSGRIKKQYAFLTNVVSGKSLNECISVAGIETLKATFGDDLKVDGNPISVSDLISYYDLKNQTSALFAMLKPEFKQQLRDKFAPSAGILLYKSAELDKLNSLLSEAGVEFDVKSYFVENAKLCDYLKEKVGDISEIDHAETYKINFTNFGFDNSSEGHSQLEKQAQTNVLFNSLLQSQDPNKQDVVKFFEEILGVTLSEFSEQKKEDLKAFFLCNKKELAHCFCNENLPKENFESLLTTLSDGCFANIGTQFTSMLYGAMIEDEDAEVLYGVMSSKIIAPIGANQDINHHGQPLDNLIIKSYYVSPSALIEQLSKEEMLTNAKTWEIIGKIVGEDEKNEILEKLEKLYDSYPDIEIFNKKAKEIASYLIVKKVIGEEKMTDLENKNPQLKELRNLIYDRAPEPSPGRKRAASSEELSGPPTKHSRALR